MILDQQEIRQTLKKDQQKDRILFGFLITIVILLFLLSLCFKTSSPGFIPPVETFTNLTTAFRLFISHLFHTSYSLNETKIIQSLPNYYISLTRFYRTIIFLLSGMAVPLAGAIFQTIYKNPMASPNIIGATAGVQLGNVIMITIYGAAALYMPLTRYGYCYGITMVIVIGVFVLTRFTSGSSNRYSVLEMVMAGSVVSQVFQVITTYLMYLLEDEDLLTYQQMNLGTNIRTDITSMIIFLIAMAVSLIPTMLIRYRFNGAGLTREEALMQGIHDTRLKIMGQICGVIMVTAAMIHCGDVGMLSMAIPHLARYFVGADFKKVSLCSMLMGASLMLLCRMISSMIYINGSELPVSFMMSLIVMPIFMVVLARQRRGFE